MSADPLWMSEAMAAAMKAERIGNLPVFIGIEAEALQAR